MGKIKKIVMKTIDEDLEKLNLYHLTKDRNIRNQLVEKYMFIAEFITKNYSIKNNISVEDLLGYSYEGLILGIEDYNPNIKSEFYRYLCSRIYQYLDIGFIQTQSGCFMPANYIKIIKESINKVESENEKSLYEDFNLIESIIEDISTKINIRAISKNELKTYILMHLRPFYIDDKKYDICSNEHSSNGYNVLAREFLIKAINKLEPKYQSILKYRFGFYDGKRYTLEEIKEKENINLGTIHYRKNAAYKKLKDFPEIKKLKGILEIYDSSNYTENSLVDSKTYIDNEDNYKLELKK